MPTRDWLTLHLTAGVGPVLARRLVKAAGSAERAVADPGEVVAVRGVSAGRAGTLARAVRAACVDADAALARAHASGMHVISPDDDAYPDTLRRLDDAPPVLFVRGDVAALATPAVGMVGTRRPTQYGREQARRFAHDLAAAGVTVVSGGAAGIDTNAHTGALVARGCTVAVLGTGCDVAYPADNACLFAKIVASGGALAGEHPPGTKPRREHFPRRNRIISGLSRVVLVVEAADGSGALITARTAATQGRRVVAVPGRVCDAEARGPLDLIRDGATLVTCPADVLGVLNEVPRAVTASRDDFPAPRDADAPANAPSPPEGLFARSRFSTPVTPATPPPATPDRPDDVHPHDALVLEALGTRTLGVEDVCSRSGLPPAVTLARLSLLTSRGVVTRADGGYRLA